MTYLARVEIILWIIQGLLAFVFLYSGVSKALLNEKTLVAKGQTGVEGLPTLFIKFIGIAEITGALGLILPGLLDMHLHLTWISAFCLGAIMMPAAMVHAKRGEYKTIGINVIIFALAIFVAYGRMMSNAL